MSQHQGHQAKKRFSFGRRMRGLTSQARLAFTETAPKQ